MKKLALLALLGLAAIPGAYARPEATPGVSADRILLGGTGPLSGPEVAYAGVLAGANAYFRHVNANGGVHGRRIEYRYYDDAYDPSRTVLGTRRLVQQDQVFAIFNTVGTEQNLAIRGFLNAAKVPQLFGGTGLRRFGQERARYPWTLNFLHSFFSEGRLYGRHIAQNRRGARVAVIYEASDYGRELLAGLRAGLGSKATVAAAEPHDITDTDVTSQMAQLKRSGATVLVVFALPKHTIASFIAAHKLGWRPQTYVTSVSIDPAVMKLSRASTSSATGEGAVAIAFVKDPTNPRWAKDPIVPLYRQIMKRYLPRANADEVVHFYGMAVAHAMVDSLRRAGRNPTRAGLLRAATHLNLKSPFMYPGIRLRTSPSDYFPIGSVQFFRFRQGRWRAFGKLVPAGN